MMTDTRGMVAELQRQVANLIRLGIIMETDHATARARVLSGELLTGWLPWVTLRAGKDRYWWPPEKGEQVILLSPSGDPAQGVIVAGLYQEAYMQNGTEAGIARQTFQDGARLEYSRSLHRLKAELPPGGTVELKAPGGLDINTQAVLSIQATQRVEISAPEVRITGNVIVGGDVIADGVSLPRHVHAGVENGGSVTNPPESG